MLKSFAKTHIGQRNVNEDSYLIDEVFGLYIVADGVGGLEKGEIASTLACQIIRDNIKEGLGLKEAIYNAHRILVSEIKGNLDKQGMATTIVAALFNGNSYDIAWVGDSRAYIWDDGLKLITKDDSYVQLLLDNGHISIEELEKHPDRNIISQALGIERKEITINQNSGYLKKDEILLLCSDGLYGIANERNIIKSIKESDRVEYITGTLVDLAVEKEGKDNITLISIKCVDCEDEIESIPKQPTIYREFDNSTGKIIITSPKNDVSQLYTHDTVEETNEEDPNLVNQTALTDLTEDDFKLLETASSTKRVKKVNSNIYLIPSLFAVILAVLAFVLFK